MKPDKNDFVAWDVATWSRALQHWENVMAAHPELKGKKGLELGANQGGLSLFFASQMACPMLCTDQIPMEKTKYGHQSFNLSVEIKYLQMDALNIPLPAESIDFVAFKSLLGILGSHGQTEKISLALREIHRVLKPGGKLFFAENLRGSNLHVWARRNFIPWGKNWYYLSLKETEDLFGDFSAKEVHSTGFFSAFVPKPIWLKNALAGLDRVCFFIPGTWRYVAFGHAIK